MQNLSQFFKSIVNACPYTQVGKQCVNHVKQKPSSAKPLKNKNQMKKAGLKTGRNLMLVGLFCPFLWYAILSGASKDFIILNMIHSGIIITLGLVIFSINYVLLFAHKKSQSNT